MRLFHSLLPVVLALSPVPIVAQEWTQFAYYTTLIGAEDMRNSSGIPLNSLGGMIQQDRANYHRFGIRHPGDSSDPYFADPALRARIAQMVDAGRNGSLANWSANRQPFGVGVFVCGYGTVPSVIYLAAWGTDHSGCY